MRSTARRGAAGILALCGLLAGLTACADRTASASHFTTDENPAEVSGTLRFMTPGYPTTPDGKAALKKVIDTFHRTYPKVRVETDLASWAHLNEKVTTSIAAGDLPDVMVTGVGWIPPFASKGAFADLGSFGLTPKTLAEQVRPGFVEPAVYDGKVYGVPSIGGAKVIAYRKSMFAAAGLDPDRPPSDIAELRAYAKKLTVRENGRLERSGFDFWVNPTQHQYTQNFATFLKAAGGSFYDSRGKADFNSPAGVRALEAMDGLMNTDRAQDFATASSDGSPMVLSGRAAMGFMGAYVDCDDKTGVGKKVCDDLGFFDITDKEQAMFMGGQIASISSRTELPGAAYQLLKVITSPEAEQDLAKLNLAIPAARAAEGSAVESSNPASEFAGKNTAYSAYSGGADNWLQLQDEFAPALDEALLRRRTPQQALDTLARKAGSM
ncbi:sugar ABC transporter substrate-binding protein [Streptomyces sp. NPDC091212]|uniref:ABC transporter substrate-binding protein n=1 Tax=Streptomyces sp. NPDC091212 TaxID=3155191 RepID=UPI003445CDDC